MTSETIRILSVGLDAGTEDRSTAALEERRDSLEVETVTDSVEAVERLEEQSFDCVVSSDTLEDGTSIELLRTVRESFPALPYVLFAETLSDELVSEAVDAGVTDYLPQKEDEARFSLLADRILDVIQQYRATERAAEFERINTVVRDINRALARASSTDEIDRRVCEILSRSEPYVFAWIGEHDPESGMVTGRAAAGVEEGYLEEITITTDEEPTAQGPTGRAVRTHELQVMQNILENPAYEPWREEALERGYRSSAAIPLVYEGTLYGVLNVYADRRDAFDADEQELFEELGDTIAYAHHDVRIRDEARRFQRAVEQAADAIFITDTDGVIEYVNPAFEELTGFSASQAMGETPRLLKSGEQSEEYYEEMWETILDGEIWSSEVLNENRSGELYYAEQTVAPIRADSGDIEGFVAIQRDVTERKEREREQQEVKRRLSLAIDTADAGVWEWDMQAENMIWEESMETLVGLDPGTFGGSHEDFIERVHPEDRETVEQADTLAREQDGDFEQEFRIRHESGNYIWLLCRVRLFTRSEDSSERMIGVAIDISDRVDRALQLRVLDRVLRHNLRNDMTTIKGYAEMIRTEVEGVDEEIEIILEESGELLQTADKEREIVKTITDPPDQKETDVVSVCQGVVAAMRKRYSESTIELNHPEEASALATGKLGRGIEELIENAIIHNDRETPEVSLTVEASEETVQVEIADNGPGIPEEEVNVLTREYDVEPLYHGSGLGLWLVNWIVRQADGTLTFKENEPRGSIVMIELQRSI